MLLAIVVVAGLLHGCTLAPEYQPPPVARCRTITVRQCRGLKETANTAWWRQLDDPVLDQLIATALAANNNVRIATANVEQALAVVTQTRFGTVSAGRIWRQWHERSHSRNGVAGMIPNLPNPQKPTRPCCLPAGTGSLGRIRSLSEAAQASMLATNEERAVVILTLVSRRPPAISRCAASR